jgi:bifunctional non-homologous end joining protein LigD
MGRNAAEPPSVMVTYASRRHTNRSAMIEARVWRASQPRWRRNPPVGFIRPCEPTLTDHPPAGSGWLHEVKHDGFRILAFKQGERIQIWSRRGADFTDRFLNIADAVRGLPADDALMDGEAVVFSDDGWSDFVALLTKRGWLMALFVAFDLLRLNGDDLRQRPLEARREALMRLVARRRGDGVMFSEALAEDGAVVFAKACEFGVEGIVSKRAGSFYRSGPSRNWLKTKNPDFVRT